MARIQSSVVTLSLSALLLLFVMNLALDLVLVRETRKVASTRDPPLSRYSFIEDDHPPRLPLKEPRRRAWASLEESVHYSLVAPESTLEWAYTGATGDSNIRLGPNHRFFNTGFSYQLHCARFLVSAYQQESPPTSRGDRAHVSRCLNVLRQFALCSADTALEPADVMMNRNLTAVRVGGERQCRDWTALYGALEQNWEDWLEVRESKV